MENPHDEYERIKDYLKQDSQGMNIREISQGLNINRNSIAKYLDILTSQDEVDVRIYGKSKVYRLAQRVPISGLLQFSSNWIIILNNTMNVVQLNDAYIRYCRIQVDRILHHNISDISIIPCNHPAIPNLAGMALTGKEVCDELSFTTSAGRIFFKVTATPTIFQDQSPGIILVFEDITDRKQYEIALKNSEEKFRNLVETSVDWIWEIDSSGKYTYSSPQVKRILGYEPEQIIGKTPFDLMQPERTERESRFFFTTERNIDTDRPVFSYENTFVHKNGHLVILETNGMQFFEKSGALAGYRGIARDITDYKRTEFIHGQYQFLQQIIDTAPNPVFYKDTHGFYRGCNRAFENVLCRNRDEIIGKTDTDLFSGEYADYYSQKEKKLLSSPGIQIYESVLPCHDGIVRNVIFNNATFTHSDGSVGGIVGVIVDITEHNQIENNLRESEIQLANAMDLAHLVKWELDIGSATFTFDDRFYSLYGTTAIREGGNRIPVATYVREFVHPDDVPFITEQSRNVLIKPLPGEQPVENVIEHRIVRRDGGIRHIIVRSRIVQDPHGRIVKVFGVNQDITDRKTAEAQITEINNAFLRFSPDPVENINILTGLAGTMLKGTCAFYNRLECGMLCSMGTWNMPADYVQSDQPEGHICYDVIRKRQSVPTVIPDLLLTVFADTDQNVRKYQLRTYIGMPVKIGSDFLGSLCVVYKNIYSPSPQDLEFLSFLSKAIAVEDKRRIAIKDLYESETRYSTMVNKAPGPVLLLRNGEVLFINDYGVRISGYSRDEIIGRNIVDFLADDSEKIKLTGILLQKNQRETSGCEAGFTRKDGRTVRVIMNTTTIPYRNDTVTLALLTNITEQKRVEDALKKANHKLGLLSGITRHDIRNQLMALGAYIQLSEDAIDKPSELMDFFSKEKRIASTIDYQIQFTQDYENIGIHAPSWKKIHEVVGEVILMLPMRDIRVETGDTRVEVFADPLLERVFYNLFDNALKYGGDAMTAIRVSHLQDSENLKIIVEDDGRGINAGDKERIFSEGFGSNTGLGLFLSREILSITGITIAETGIPGSGARFEITVPEGAYRFRE